MKQVPHPNWSLHDWLSYLEKQHPKSIDLGLERICQVADALFIDQPAMQVITVGGTNGKGSTVRMLEQILLADARRTGTYTSPHFIKYNERVRVAGEELDDAEHCAAFAAVEAARGDTTLTYFEHGTLAALWLLKQAKVDVAILEVGLGGRLDAVNIIDPDIAVVTTVGIDHVDFLGDNREQIGFEKAGIYRTDKPAICADPEPPQRLLEHARTIGARLRLSGEDFSYQLTETGWNFSSENWSLSDLPLPHLPLVNAATALAALCWLPQRPSHLAVAQGLERAQLPGRLEVRESATNPSIQVILDVAHNPHAASYLSQQLQGRWPQRRIHAVCGMLRDKDIQGTLSVLSNQVDDWYLASLPEPRGATADQLATALSGERIQTFASVQKAYKNALADAEAGDIVLCFGSFLTIQAIYEVEG
ncbi:bifunctional tetrahydrofolate synthase/dihydrofolate synthase [Aliidiomarina sp. Khilg15.8]